MCDQIENLTFTTPFQHDYQMDSTNYPVHTSELLISFPSGKSKIGNINKVQVSLLDTGATSNIIYSSLLSLIDAIITSKPPV